MVQHIVTCKTLQVVVRFRASLAGFVEFGSVQRHGIDVGLKSRSARRGGPDSSRPLFTDVCTMLGSNAVFSLFFPVAKNPPSFIHIELHFIHIPLIIDIDDGRAVAVDGLLGDGLCGEARIAF